MSFNRNQLKLSRYSAQANTRYNAGGVSVGNSKLAPLGRSAANGQLSQSGFQTMSAAGAPGQGGVAPRIGLQVVNTTATTVSNFDLWGAYAYANTGIGTWSGGSWTYNGITVSAVYNQNVTYQQLLQSTISQPFQVGMIYIQVLSNTTNASVTDTCTINLASQSGKASSEPFNTLLSPNQQQANIGYNYVSFGIDGFTKFTLSNVYASSTVQYSFYPQTQVNASNALNGGQVMAQSTQAPTFLY